MNTIHLCCVRLLLLNKIYAIILFSHFYDALRGNLSACSLVKSQVRLGTLEAFLCQNLKVIKQTTKKLKQMKVRSNYVSLAKS